MLLAIEKIERVLYNMSNMDTAITYNTTDSKVSLDENLEPITYGKRTRKQTRRPYYMVDSSKMDLRRTNNDKPQRIKIMSAKIIHAENGDIFKIPDIIHMSDKQRCKIAEKDADGSRDGFAIDKNRISKHMMRQAEESLSRYPENFKHTIKIVYIDGHEMRTTKIFINNPNIDYRCLCAINLSNIIAREIRKTYSIVTYGSTIESITDTIHGLDLKGAKLANIYIDTCQTFTGTELGSPLYALDNCLKYYSTVGTYIGLTVCLRYNTLPNIKHSEIIQIIINTIQHSADSNKLKVSITYNKYKSHMCFFGISVIGTA